MINGQNGAFGGRMLQFNVDPFTKEETKRYLSERLSSLKFTDEGFERFYSCTRGFLLILIVYLLFCLLMKNVVRK